MDEWITVTEELLDSDLLREGRDLARLPEEIADAAVYAEGSVERIVVNRYERAPCRRADCVRHYGTKCVICGFDFVGTYGEVMAGFTHVHHLAAGGYRSRLRGDPVVDLRPVCPNCHAVLHRREPPYSLEEVGQLLRYPTDIM